MRRFLIGVAAICLLASSTGAAETVLFKGAKLSDCALAEPIDALGPIEPNGSWAQQKDAIVATGTAAPWTVRTVGDAGWTDYRLSAKVTIRTPGPKADYPIHHWEYDRYLPRQWYPPGSHTGQFRYRYFAGEFDWGSDAALLFRYQDRENGYRVQLSTEYQELILWHGTGGYLQVVPCELEPGRTYAVQVLCRGQNIQVLVDGAKKIDYWHRTLPTLSGKVGMAAYRSTVAFQDVTVTAGEKVSGTFSAKHPTGPAGEKVPDTFSPGMPPHKPVFTTRRWRTLRWVFDGAEPICLMTVYKYDAKAGRTGPLRFDFVKLLPGYRPQVHGWVGVKPAPLPPPKHSIGNVGHVRGGVESVQAAGEGTDTLTLEFETDCPNGIMSARHTDELTFDAVRGVYRHDITHDMTFKIEKKLWRVEVFDPLTYNNKEPGRGVKYRWLPAGQRWGLLGGEKGKIYRHPLSQSLHLAYQNNWHPARGKTFWMLYPSRAACPLWTHRMPGEPYEMGVCHWGYDFHQRVLWGKKGRAFKPGDKLRAQMVMTGCPPAEAERMFLKSTLHPNHEQYKTRPLSQLPKRLWKNVVPDAFAFPVLDPAGVDFTRLYNIREPFIGWYFGGKYTVDKTVGHNDSYSLRLDGPAFSQATIYHHMIDGYAKRYLCTLWLKTRGVTGPGPVIELFRKAGPFDISDTVKTNIAGDTGWQQITFVTKMLTAVRPAYDGTEFRLSLTGAGQVWMDDLSIRPIGKGEQVEEALPAGAQVSKWDGKVITEAMLGLRIKPNPPLSSIKKLLFMGRKLKAWKPVPPVNALGPIPKNGKWEKQGDAIVASGTAAPWTIRTAGDATWTDYKLSAEVTIAKPGAKANYPILHSEFDRYLPREWYPPNCNHTGQYRYRYYAGEFDWGSDAAVFVRYQDRENCYRVQLSTEYQELILWHGTGGYLQVVPCKLEPGRRYRLQVVAAGQNIRVLLDGVRKIDYWHRTLPTLTGKVGLAAYRSTVKFQNVLVTEAPPPPATPVHKPRFATRIWRTGRWIFDGNEPIGLLEKDQHRFQHTTNRLYLIFVKLVPGYRPYYTGWLGVSLTGNPGVSQLVGTEHNIKTTGERSERLGLRFDTLSLKKDVVIHQDGVLTYDRVRGTYRYDWALDCEFLRDRTTREIEFTDPLTYNNKFPGRGVKHGWLPSGHEWGLFGDLDGTPFRHPISQGLHIAGQNSWNIEPCRNFWMLYPDRAACPIWIHDVPNEKFRHAVCHWGWDWHQTVRWPKTRTFKAGERFKIKFAATALPPHEADRIYRKSVLHPQQDRVTANATQRVDEHSVGNGFAFPVCDPAGTDFTRRYTVRKPFVGWQFSGRYTLDDAVGHGDSCSLRLDEGGKTEAFIYHHMMDGNAKRFLCTVWVKTRGVLEKGPVVVLKYPWKKTGPRDALETGITGDTDWQRLSFVTKVPGITPMTYDCITFGVQLEGKGRVWIDDFSIRPIPDGEKADDHLPRGAKLDRWPGWSK